MGRQRMDSSVAYDLPLTDPHGGNIPPGHLMAALRNALADHSEREVEQVPRDAFGIPVLDASPAVHTLTAHPRFHLPDALHATAAPFTTLPEPNEPAELRLRGFLLLDESTCRPYLDPPGAESAPPFGVDLPLRDEDGSLVVGMTAAHSALPVLLLGGWNASGRTPTTPTAALSTTWRPGSPAADGAARGSGRLAHWTRQRRTPGSSARGFLLVRVTRIETVLSA
ncbi:hypothetical protein ACFWOB_34795 [Streptomyces sp. NPDC058420]|uniref:hypothetical protein n=1 Tax=Streptomyces sp. NPDC058420 TaxID=3346489 RepID=UPI003669EDB8